MIDYQSTETGSNKMKLGEANVGDRVSFWKNGYKTGTVKIVQGWDAYIAVDGGGRETMRLAALDRIAANPA